MDKIGKRLKRIKHIRKKVSGDTSRPRVTVYRSNKHIYIQIVDDTLQKTLLGLSDTVIQGSFKPVEKAKKLGEFAGEKASKLGITKVVFDRRGYKFHGRVKSLADGLRHSGLQF